MIKIVVIAGRCHQKNLANDCHWFVVVVYDHQIFHVLHAPHFFQQMGKWPESAWSWISNLPGMLKNFGSLQNWMQTALHSAVSVHTLKELICTLQREVISHSHLKVDFPACFPARTVCKQRWNPRVWQDEGLSIASNSAIKSGATHWATNKTLAVNVKQTINHWWRSVSGERTNDWKHHKDDKYPEVTTDKCKGHGLCSVISSPLCSSSWHRCGGSDNNQPQPTTKIKNKRLHKLGSPPAPTKQTNTNNIKHPKQGKHSKQLKATEGTNPAR